MKEKVFIGLLLIVEVVVFYTLMYVLNIPGLLIFKLGLIWFFFAFLFNHFKMESSLVWEEISNLFKVYLCYMFISLLFFSWYHTRINLIAGLILSIFSLLFDRFLRIFFRNHFSKKTLIIGTGNQAYRVYAVSKNNRYALTNVTGFIQLPDEVPCEDISTLEKMPLYQMNDLNQILSTDKLDQIIIADPDITKEQSDVLYKKIFDKVKYIEWVPKVDFTVTFDSKIHDYDGVLLVSTSTGKIGFFQKAIKRVIDIAAGIFGCILCLPLTAIVKYKSIKDGDHDPIFFRQERIGKNGKPIYIWKYRSMIPNAEAELERLMKEDPAIRKEYEENKKLVNDPRITKLGHFLRKTSLDEFPQFWNVLKGDMSLVGPRPYLPREIKDMDVYYQSIIKCKPGITGMWQANGRSDVGFTDRCKLDDYYYRNWTLGLDMIIVYKTIKSVIYGKGAL